VSTRGPKPKRSKPITWNSNVAYAVGLLVTDGCLFNDGRHIDLTSKDVEQLENFNKCLDLDVNITYKSSGMTGSRISRLQFSDVVLYRFLESIGLTPAKTHTIGEIKVPNTYFFDFLRGHLDGDGSFYSYWDPRWKSSLMFYLTFTSASIRHLAWLERKIGFLAGVEGKTSTVKYAGCYRLRYAKKSSLVILRKMYSPVPEAYLSRKYLKVVDALGRVDLRL
jgi:hypothetical protein